MFLIIFELLTLQRWPIIIFCSKWFSFKKLRILHLKVWILFFKDIYFWARRMVDSNSALSNNLWNKSITSMFQLLIPGFSQSFEIVEPIFRYTMLQLHFYDITLGQVYIFNDKLTFPFLWSINNLLLLLDLLVLVAGTYLWIKSWLSRLVFLAFLFDLIQNNFMLYWKIFNILTWILGNLGT